jgi:hypothetical protein
MAKRKGTSLAQSGGINHTFGGGKGGTSQSKGVTQGRKIGKGKLNNGLNYNVRTEGGSSTLKSASFHVGPPPPVHAGQAPTTKVKIQKPIRGGAK